MQVSSTSTKRVFVFLCDSKTKGEVFERKLVGTTMKFGTQAFGDLQTGDLILICDYLGGHVSGPFRITECGMPLCRDAWPGRGFVFQARFEECGPRVDLSVDKVLPYAPFFWKSGTKQPRSSFRGDEAVRLLELFGWSGEESPVIKTRGVSVVSHSPGKAQPKAPEPQTTSPSTPPTYQTVQGFFVRSKAEQNIANWFDKAGIRCHYEKPAPGHSRYLCDFYLPDYDVYVEYWGLLNDAAYAERAKAKRLWYRDAGVKLIEIVPEDEHKLDAALRRKLLECNVSLSGARQTTTKPDEGLFSKLLRYLRSLFG